MDFYFIFSLLVLMTSGLFGVADGKWHDIQIKWMKDEVWLNIDYGQYEITQQSFNSVGGKVVTKVMVGDSSDKENYVQGCVRVSVLGVWLCVWVCVCLRVSASVWLRPA